MLIRRSSLCSAMLLGLWPTIATAHPLVGQKRSNLPCLMGQPAFSERLIANNPWISNKAYLLSDSFLGFTMVGVRLPMGPYSLGEMKQFSLLTFKRWGESIHYASTKLDPCGELLSIIEGAFYLNRFAVLYGSSKPTYALVIGNTDQSFKIHGSLGRFPVHFGSNFTEYSLAPPLQSKLGVTANVPAGSINFGYCWNLKHETKLRVFGFIGDSVGADTKSKNRINVKGRKEEKKPRNLEIKEKIIEGGKHFGFNVHHEWNPDFGGVIIGVSGVSALPVKAKDGVKNSEMSQSGFDGYVHLNIGSIKIRIEALVGIPQQAVKSGLRWKKDKAVKVESYAGHAEIAYRLPFKQESNAVIGHTRGMSQLLTTSGRVYLGLKTSIADNLQLIFGYQLEPVIDNSGRAQYFSTDAKNSLTIQLNYTV